MGLHDDFESGVKKDGGKLFVEVFFVELRIRPLWWRLENGIAFGRKKIEISPQSSRERASLMKTVFPTFLGWAACLLPIGGDNFFVCLFY